VFELRVKGRFSAAHMLRGYRGKCARLHGHNWEVEVAVEAEGLSEAGMVIDFGELKGMLGEVLDELDHKLLNDIPPFDRLNPTSENIAKWIFDRMKEKLSGFEGVRVSSVTVRESEGVAASYRE